MSIGSRFAIAAAAALTMTAGQAVQSASAFELDNRWTSTATDGGGLSQGDPTTLTWSFLPDGVQISGGAEEPSRPSDLISFLDANFGTGPGGADLTQRPWFSLFGESYDRLEALSGLTFVYEPNDDGATFVNSSGLTNVRGDMRIGGHSIDGASNILAYNYYPNVGDMVIDTDDAAFYTGPSIGFKNVVMHEAIHGLGVGHVVSSDAAFLMEPTINTSFFGPQLDDLLALQRHYGDKYEKAGGNDTAPNATYLGSFSPGSSTALGTAGDSTVITAGETDFLSIDDNSDLDFFRFNLTSAATVSAILTPKGATYQQGPQRGSQSALDTTSLSDLVLALIDSDGTSVLALADDFGAGSAESILDFELASAGDYFLQVTGLNDNIQLYQIDLAVVAMPEPSAVMLLGLGAVGGLLRRRRSA